MPEQRTRLRLTGWAVPEARGCLIQGLHIHLKRPLEAPGRVTLSSQFKTGLDATVRYALAREARPAQYANGSFFEVTGQLLRLDRSEGRIKLKVHPRSPHHEPYFMTLRAGDPVLAAADPDAFAVRVRGQLLPVGDLRVLLAAEIVTVRAPVPPHWHRWRAGRVGLVIPTL